MWDITTSGVTAALDGLAARQDVRAHNVANAETPGFRAMQVNFEDSLRDALRRGAPERMESTEIASPTIVNANGNSVDLETEMVGSMKDGLHARAMVESFNFKTGNLRMAMKGIR